MTEANETPDTGRESTQGWWIATDALARGGEKILGPFATRELALEVRRYVEIVKKPLTFWVDQEKARTATTAAEQTRSAD